MGRIMKSKLVSFTLLSFILASATFAASKNNIKNFTGKTIQGKQIMLSDFKGKVVLLDFWASWCYPCRKEMPQLVKLYRKHKKDGFIIIGVNIDDHSENMKKFLNKLFPQPDFPIVWDSDKKIPAEFDIMSMPTTIVFDKTGKERFRHNGFELSYIKDYEKEIQTLKKEK